MSSRFGATDSYIQIEVSPETEVRLRAEAMDENVAAAEPRRSREPNVHAAFRARAPGPLPGDPLRDILSGCK
jgi:hypothetical protein